ncbi:tRNA lysidine(34) synthetase TilS [Celerinatantimonas diazotrophica]|uniref:tRNA(Ile)-lysidine synthase n=1 Tax=Celerinatantimonas diazotrophica TaxID=412034 RepID=A0A4R1J9V5_9GAMM|nr:tRNA lysidine(34) synthetase TilS [Celerinatantimonas diazotrophica]TCK47300.1 tRNA(Ile)-lysidine synthase [Celerinatantimonas diazotrophica]CAG9296073.1 tRNA(Ile)-lysidine synthase [Celerinatantimonas diazotrophica]
MAENLSLDVASFHDELTHCQVQSQPLMVALSGGVDSVVLLHLLWQSRQLYPTLQIKAVHVHHGLNFRAQEWAKFCQKLCARWDIPLAVEYIRVPTGPRLSIEEQARIKRYQVFERYTHQGFVIVCAHHQNDQAETFFLNLNRGSGLAGLSAMGQTRPLGQTALIRPLLHFSRAQIEAYAQYHRLDHIHDDSNDDTRYERNFIRHEVLPVLNERWPQFNQQVAKSSQWIWQAQQLNDELAQMDLTRLSDAKARLSENVRELSAIRLVNVLRFWLKQRSGRYPAQESLEQFIQQLSSGEDRSPEISICGGIVRRYQHYWQWAEEPVCYQPVSCVWPKPYKALAWSYMSLSIVAHGRLRPPRSDEQVIVRFRHEVGNLKMRPIGRGGSRSLKKLLQELAFPPWLRNCVPLIFYGDQFVAVADRLIDERFIDPERQGWQLVWQFYADTLPGPQPQ